MSEIAGQAGMHGAASPVVHESYSFACMRCGHGWEQSYEIEHHRDTEGHEFVMYVTDGQVVPSPLSRPSCQNCDGHVLRIMRAGQVSSALGAVHRQQQIPRSRPAEAPPAGPVEAPAAASEAAPHEQGEQHHWHLSDLLHPFHRKAS
ncbi:hypothetical protein OG985_26840 [Streptomyces sp. NBC_00289]|uniref:hypothetical protein n=1 Tax=Streptomyces sp. NBC_00289 TaxID=2975703 RepID=UPI003246AD4A